MNIPIVVPILNWRNKINKSGVYPIHLRIYIHPEPHRYYPVKLPGKVPPDQWTGIEGVWVCNKHPFAFEINTRIAEIKGKITELTKRFYNQGKPITFYAIEREILRKGDRSLLNDYVRNYIDTPPEHVELDPVTWEKYEAFLMHLNNFNQRIKFNEIDEAMIDRIRKYLTHPKGRKNKLAPATIKSYFDKFRVVLMHAAKKDHLLDFHVVEQYFNDRPIQVPLRKEGLHLEIEEIQKLRKLKFDKKDSSLERDRDLFLFQVYTGFYYNDLQVLKKTQLFRDVEYGSYIIGERDKNSNPTIIPLFKFPYAAQILEKYADKHDENEFMFRKNAFIEVQAYNRNLKLLAKRAGIIRPLSNKTGRHTNAQMWIRFGADRPVLSKMMGHIKEATTENYYKVNIREVFEGTREANFDRFQI
jgi:site-specific recombinase XerD